MSLIPSSRNNLCPVCEISDGRCRQGREDADYWQCMTYADAKKGDVISGYKCLGQSKNGLWGQFRIDNSQEWSEQQRLEWKQRNQQRQQQIIRDEEERRQKSLKAEDRHAQYTSLLSELALHSEDREDLIRRGFSTEQIELSGFKSVEKYQTLQKQYTELLPGIGAGGGSLIVSNDGYLIPVRNADGLIVACQIRLRSLPAGEKNRYRWLSSKKASAHIYTTGFNPKGEMPLAIHRPQGKPTGLGLIEGTGAKPFLPSQWFNVLVIGAAGGLFASSESIFKSCLERFSEELGGTREIAIYPDKGSVIDIGVMSRWRKTIDLLEKWDWSVKVAWWGQVDKSFPDIDELSEFERGLIKFISVEEFFKIEKKEQKKLEQAKKKADEARQREIEDGRYQDLTSITEVPWKRVNTPKLNLDELALEPGFLYLLIAAKSTGKTSGVAMPLVAKAIATLIVTHLRSLGLESSQKLGVPWQDDIQIDGVSKLACTINSLYKVNPTILSKEGSFFLMDEADQVLAQAFEDICNKQGERMLILRAIEHHLKRAIRSNGLGVLMSADLTQKEIDLLKKLFPDLPIRVIINDYQPKMGKLYFDESGKPDRVISKILERCKAGLPCFVVSDFKGSMRGCKSIAELIRRQCPELRVEEINGDVTKHPQVIDFLKHIDKASKDVDLIICSPAVTSGISIENQRFIGGVFGIFFGVLSVSKACQALARIRGAEIIHVWAANKAKGGKRENGLIDPEAIKQRRYSNHSRNARFIQSFVVDYDPMTGEFLSPWFDHYCKLIAQENLEKNAYRRRMKEKLIAEGYELGEVEESESVKNLASELERGFKQTTIAIAQSLDKGTLLSDTEYELYKQITKEPKPTPQHQQFVVSRETDFKKTVLYHSLGEELISRLTHEVKVPVEVPVETPVEAEEQPTEEKVKVEKETVTLSGYAAAAMKISGNFKSELESYHLLRCDISDSAAKDWWAESKQLEFSGERFAGDTTWNARKKAARDFLEVPQFIDKHKDVERIPEQEIRAMAIKARCYADLCCEVLGLKQVKNPKTRDAQIVGEILNQVGIKIDSKRNRQTNTYERWIDLESLAQCEAYHQHKLRQKAEREAKAQAKLGIEPEYLTATEKLKEALATCKTLEEFAAAIQGYTSSEITEAVYLQDSQHLRTERLNWLEALEATVMPSDVEPAGESAIASDGLQTKVESDQGLGATVRAYAELLAEGVACGVEAILILLKPWSAEERWGAFLELEQQAPEKMERLAAIAPNWSEWCDA
ncbi:MAG: hypothetical protein M3O33_19695 [Cyanobacteriota bacterium]|nr:hypothetical protein [Cyanobacteriota bacterium]